MNLSYHPSLNNRSKRFKPNKPPPSHHVNDEFSEISSLVRQCRYPNINYDDNIVKIEGDFTDISDVSLHNDKYSSDDSVIDEEYIPFDGMNVIQIHALRKNTPKRWHLKNVGYLAGSNNCDVVGDNKDDGDQIVE